MLANPHTRLGLALAHAVATLPVLLIKTQALATLQTHADTCRHTQTHADTRPFKGSIWGISFGIIGNSLLNNPFKRGLGG